MFAGHRIRLGCNHIGHLVNNILLLFFIPSTRCAISVTQSSWTMTPNITAVPVGKASVMAALPRPLPSLREAGVLALSESVTSASSRELHMQVNTHSQ